MRRAVPWLAFALILAVPALAFADDGGSFEKYQARGWLWMYLASFGFGFLTSLTPCVYPMIPITLAIFGARGEDVSRRRAVLLATVYVVGMGVTYSTLGVTFALLGQGTSFGSQLASPWVVIPLAILFAALAASMFGAFELNLPLSWQARLNQVGGKGYGGAFAMGLVGGLIAAPCTGPFLAGLLAYVSTTGSVGAGGGLLFVYAIGMGVLFWLIAAFAVGLPKSGAWMDGVKSVGGQFMLIEALNLLRPLYPPLRHFASPAPWFLAVAIGIVVLGVAIGGVHLSFHGTFAEKARKAFGTACIVGGAFAIWVWTLTPKTHLPWVMGDEDAAFAQARTQHKGVMVDFSATWCTPCEEMELTFGDSEVYTAITDDFVTLKLDVSKGDEHDLALRKRYGAVTLPSVVFLDTDGHVLGRVSKLLGEDAMLDVVRPAAAKVHGR
jgi:thiol:disulfide interchange protein DsbD